MYMSNRERRTRSRLEVELRQETRNLKIRQVLFAVGFVLLLFFRVRIIFNW